MPVTGPTEARSARVDSPAGRVFLLSPAQCGGERALLMTSPRAGFDLATRLRSTGGVTLGEVMSFLSALYFRGKLAYARAFARPPSEGCAGGVLVITPHAGLKGADTPITAAGLRAAAQVDISAENPRYRRPLESSARALLDTVGEHCEIVLLGSIASGKYVDVLLRIFGDRLTFPADFVGRGDMSRGGLLLRCVADRRELDYVSVGGAVRHGQRPPRLAPLRRDPAAPRW